ncbi:MAG: hypothetical protein GWN77_02620 [Gammaproteobacteria bacterium]|nr:hypothetical protein [Gammaproteobacteria bacterium]
MTIPRLPPDSSSIDVTITVNERLRPYFTAWYQKFKEEGESPQKFALRNLKEAALDDYIALESGKIRKAMNEDLAADTAALLGEVND